MGRSLKKGPYVDATLLGRVEGMNRSRQKKVLDLVPPVHDPA